MLLSAAARAARCRSRRSATGATYLGWGCTRAIAAEEAARSELARQSERASAPTSCSWRTRACARCSSCGRRLTVRSQAGRRCSTRRPTRIRARSSSTAASTHSVVLGSPVINEAGVLGQVTRVYPAVVRGDAADRQAMPRSRCSTAARRRAAPRSAAARRRRPARDALHGRQRRRAGRRRADDLGRRRRLPAGPAGRQGRERRPQGRLGLRAHRC